MERENGTQNAEMESVMKKLTLTLLASAALALPAALPAMAQNTPANQPPQAQQPQAQQPQQPQAQNQQNQSSNQQASTQRISPQRLGRSGIRQVQQALNKKGFDAGHADGMMGRQTREALLKFQRSKGIHANGTLNRKTLSDLGVQVAQNNPGSQPSMSKGNNNQPSQNQNGQGTNGSPSTTNGSNHNQ